MADAEAVGALVAELRASRKYAQLDGQALARVAAWALDRTASRKEAAKAARRKLHQVYGAYLPARGIADAERAARKLAVDELPTACRAVLACHASTRERLEVMEGFFRAAFGANTGQVQVVDLGAGLNPFAIPWMPLEPGASYLAVDVDERIERLVEQLGPHVPVELTARTEDLVSATDPITADLVFLLKLVPPLEQQAPGSAMRLFERIRAGRVVISVSAHSLGGRKRGMREQHASMLQQMIPGLGARAERHEFPSETMFVLSGT